jgi:hypothetical protein
MLTADYLDVLPGPILELYERYTNSIIRDIARRLMGLSIQSAAWQMQRLTESGAIYENALREIARLTGYSEDVLRQIFEAAGVTSLRFDTAIYRAYGLDPLPLNQSPEMVRLLVAGLRRTHGIMMNLTRTTALSAQMNFIKAADLAWLQVSTGARDYNSAIREAVKGIGTSGLEVLYPTGHMEKLDVAMRRTVLTGVTQTTGEMQMALVDELGVDTIAVSAHIGARDKGEGPMNHESWQGRVYSLRGSEYPNFYQVTGYGTGEGLGGYNCRHSFYPYFDGVSENFYNEQMLKQYADTTVTYNGKSLSYYEATQVQRRYEREIRKAKRELTALEAAGLDAGNERARVKNIQAALRDFLRQTGLNRQNEREQI